MADPTCCRCGGLFEARRSRDGTSWRACPTCVQVCQSLSIALDVCGVPPPAQRRTTTELIARASAAEYPALLAVQRWTKLGGELLLHGPPQAGKTRLAHAAIVTLLTAEADVHRVDESTWYTLPGSRNQARRTGHERFELSLRVDVLVFDGLARRPYNRYGMECLAELIQARRRLSTLWLSRLTPGELSEWALYQPGEHFGQEVSEHFLALQRAEHTAAVWPGSGAEPDAETELSP